MDYKKQFGISEGEMREAVDYAEVGRLAGEIAETARQASTAIQEMDAADSEERRNEIAIRVQELIAKGAELANRQNLLVDRLNG